MFKKIIQRISFINVLKITIVTDILSCIVIFLKVVLIDKDVVFALYGSFLSLGNIFFPTMIGAIIYLFIKYKVKLRNKIQTILLQVFVLCLIFVSALFIWAMIDTLLRFGEDNKFTVENILRDYNSEFSGYLFVALFQALAIPFLFYNIDIIKKSHFDKISLDPK
jgi:hypothetical protein